MEYDDSGGSGGDDDSFKPENFSRPQEYGMRPISWETLQ
jgi:hypothetical protein